MPSPALILLVGYASISLVGVVDSGVKTFYGICSTERLPSPHGSQECSFPDIGLCHGVQEVPPCERRRKLAFEADAGEVMCGRYYTSEEGENADVWGGTRTVGYSERREEIPMKLCMVVQTGEEAASSRTRIGAGGLKLDNSVREGGLDSRLGTTRDSTSRDAAKRSGSKVSAVSAPSFTSQRAQSWCLELQLEIRKSGRGAELTVGSIEGIRHQFLVLKIAMMPDDGETIWLHWTEVPNRKTQRQGAHACPGYQWQHLQGRQDMPGLFQATISSTEAQLLHGLRLEMKAEVIFPVDGPTGGGFREPLNILSQ
ncbi:hypothetical protein BS47DRAFT_1358493 [Hydnum rufescens UP504]|uniref:Uncharacterized protein n=1 Tax=Hydnum rufescens UP504 TaxID=1448309 RepID=A0A9P6B809_9AGAM|nr:hypothetical protein BS47DRAFT_1358493 [Hydnum rufescens UP504]